MEEQDNDEEELWALLEKTLRNACEAFVETREKEGENLKTDLLNKLDEMIGYVDFIEERSPIVMKEYRERLETKVKESRWMMQELQRRLQYLLIKYVWMKRLSA